MTTASAPNGFDIDYHETLPQWLTFDQFGRYSIIRESVNAMRQALGRDTLRILDVGGWTRTIGNGEGLPIVHFLPNDEIIVLDQVESALPQYLRGDGRGLDFPENHFDLVTTADTLEHVPAADRPQFIEQLLRVARYGVMLVAPFAHPTVDAAEELLFAYIKAELGVIQEQLAEHRGYGLPQIPLIEEQLQELGIPYERYPSGYVHSWLAMMLAKHYLFGRTGDIDLHTSVDRYYIRWLASTERKAPSYRWAFIMAKDPADDWLGAVHAAIAPTLQTTDDNTDHWPQVVSWLMDLLQVRQIQSLQTQPVPIPAPAPIPEPASNALAETLAQTIAGQHAQVAHLQRLIDARDAAIHDLRERAEWQAGQIAALQEELRALKGGKVLKVAQWLKR